MTSLPAHARLRGGVQTGAYPVLDPRNFPDENPLTVEPRQLLKVIGGNQPPRCVPPDKQWRLLDQDQGNCLYAVPLSPTKQTLYRGNIVVAKANIYDASRNGQRCGPDPWDDGKAVCSKGNTLPLPNGANGGGWNYGPYTYNIPPWTLPDVLRTGLSNGTCVPDDPRAPSPHITCQSLPPNCANGAPGGYDPSANPACQTLIANNPPGGGGGIGGGNGGGTTSWFQEPSGLYNAYPRDNNGAARARRQVSFTNDPKRPGFKMLTTQDGKYQFKLNEMRPDVNGADYITTQTKPPMMMRIIQRVSGKPEYDIYYSTGSGFNDLPSEIWLPDWLR